MEKYLKLSFENAGLFRNKKTKDFVFEYESHSKRSKEKFFIEPITVHQISNVLHVLFGERPVPSLRNVVYKKVDYYFQKALDSYLKIDSFMRFNKYTNKEEFVSEKLQTKKAVSDSWNNGKYLYWERVSKILEPELFEKFKELISNEFKINPMDYSFIQIIDMIHSSNNQTIYTWLENQKGKKCLANDIKDYYKNSSNPQINMNKNRTAITVTNGLEEVIRLKGELLIPVSNDDIEKLRNCKGCATILDGGLVIIKGIESENTLQISDFTPVNEISTEKY